VTMCLGSPLATIDRVARSRDVEHRIALDELNIRRTGSSD
jgi:hypothetical protein